MRRIATLAIAMLSCVPALGQDLLANLDRDVLRGLLLTGDQSLVTSRSVPAELAEVRMPRELQLVGGAERSLGRAGPGGVVTVSAGYKSSLPPEAALKLAIDALVSRGGVAQSGMMTPGNGVFISSSITPQQMVCLVDRPVTLTASAMDGATYVVLSTQRTVSPMACDGRMRPAFARQQNPDLPRLELPSDPSTGRPAQMSGSSGGSGQNEQMNAQVRFAMRDSPASVAAHFARQMTEQGWVQDATWSGSVAAGSTWLKPRQGKPALLASLQVVTLAEGRMTTLLNISARQ